MARVKQFEDLDCWKEARILVKDVYSCTSMNSFSKDYALKDQIRRAAISIMLNISEGFSRRSNKEFLQYLFISLGSISELQAALYIAIDQKYITDEQFDQLYQRAETCAKMISKFATYLRENITKQTRQTR